MDDAAVLEFGGRSLVLTKDLLVEGVHYLPDDPPGDVAWKLVAVNLSDLAAKAARPLGALLGYALRGPEWDRHFATGLQAALNAFEVPLLGGDTVAAPGAQFLSLTLLGEASGQIPSRSGAQTGDDLWVTGAIGGAGVGLAMLTGSLPPVEALVQRYRAPRPRLEAGLALGPIVHAMMDVSDGLLIDAARMAEASDLGLAVELDKLPLCNLLIACLGQDRAARLQAATAGDDYELLFAAPPAAAGELRRLSETLGLPFTRIGRFTAGSGLSLLDAGEWVPLPPRLGYQHQTGR
jgi:thiamine-monophosphate kinase